MSRPVKLTAAQKKEQGQYIKALYKSYQAKKGGDRKYNQHDFGKDLGLLIDDSGQEIIAPSLQSQWFSGQTTIPDHAWFALSEFFVFDPFELRPDLLDTKAKLDALYDKWRGANSKPPEKDHKALLECYMKADRRGKDHILQIAKIEALRTHKLEDDK